MFWNFFRARIQNMNGLFNGHFIEVKSFYALEFNAVPCISFIGELDVTKAFSFIKERYSYQIKSIYQHAYFDHEEKKMLFNNTIFVLHNKRMIELGSNYCQVLFTNMQYAWANELINDLVQFRKVAEPAKETRVIGFARQTNEN